MVVKRTIEVTHKLMTTPFSLLGTGIEYFVKGRSLQKKTGAKFAKGREDREYFASNNKGLLIDGYSHRLSEATSFQNIAYYGVTGAGKSSVLRSMLFDKADSNSVFIVNDMKGSIYKETSGYMKSKGYRIIVLNPYDLEHSHRFNPFPEIQNENETMHMAQMFVQAVSSSKDPIWGAGAERFVTFFLKCLKKKGMPYNTPHNLYYLFQSFGEDGSRLHGFVAECVYDDPFMLNEWKSLLSVHEEGILSFIMNATTALKIFANKDVCTLTASSTIDLSTLRKHKTVIYVVAPPLYQKLYRPVTSMYFLSLLQACMREVPAKKDFNVYFLYDEFGNSYLPDFDAIATTVREYRVSLVLFMQGINQLARTYGRDEMSVILSGIVTQISFGAAEQETAEYFERRAGKVRIIQRPEFKDPHIEHYQEYHLISASEIRELSSDKILVISGNRKTSMIDFVKSHQHPRYRKFMQYSPAPIVSKQKDRLEFLSL